MKWLALACSLAALPAAAADCALEYRFHADWSAERRFEASVSFDAGERDLTRVRLVSEWGGVADFHRGIRDLRVEPEGASVAQDDAPNRWQVKHRPGGRVTVRYRVVNATPDVDGTSGVNQRDFYRNTLGATRFQLFGHAVLVVPESLPDSDQVDACFTFSGLDPAWSFASNAAAGHTGGAASWRVTASPQRLRSSLFLGGDYRLHRRQIQGRPLWIALRGEWGFADAQFADAAAGVVESHRRFWNDFDFPHFLVSLSPNRLPGGSTGGTALHNAFAMHAARDFTVPGWAFEHILAHEHLHTWIPRRLGTSGEGEAARYWFSEGFTNYLTHRLLLASGYWGLEEYGRALNQELRQYFTSPERDASNARIAEQFWKKRAVERIPYRRGELFALHLSRRLADRGMTLEAALRSIALPETALPREGGRRPDDLAVNRLVAALRPHLGDSIDADLHEHIELGRPVEVGADYLGPCFEGRTVPMPRYELGFDADLGANPSDWKVRGLVRGSAAARAGLREGDPIRSFSWFDGQTDREVEVILYGDDGLLKEIRYLPVAAAPVDVRQFTPRPHASADPACRRWISGTP